MYFVYNFLIIMYLLYFFYRFDGIVGKSTIWYEPGDPRIESGSKKFTVIYGMELNLNQDRKHSKGHYNVGTVPMYSKRPVMYLKIGWISSSINIKTEVDPPLQTINYFFLWYIVSLWCLWYSQEMCSYSYSFFIKL